MFLKQIIVTIVMFIATLSVKGHGIDVSTIFLVEQEDKSWTLEIRSSIDAYIKEVKIRFADSPYQSQEEFKEQLKEYFETELKLIVDDRHEVSLAEPVIQLGHETLMFYKGIELPGDMSSIKIVGTVFQNIYGSKAKLLVLKQGFKKQPFILNSKNNYTADLHVENNGFAVQNDGSALKLSWPLISGIALSVILLSLLLIRRYSVPRSNKDSVELAK